MSSTIDKQIARLEPPRAATDPFAFVSPSRIGIFGSSGSGKTHFLVKYLCSHGLKVYDQIIWCAPAGSLQQPKLKLLKSKWNQFCHFVEGLDEAKIEQLIQQGFAQNPPYATCVVIDDLMLESCKSKFVQSLWISGRHRNVTIIEMKQSIFSGGGRLARLNQEYYVLGRNGAQRDEAARLFQQLTHSKHLREQLMTAYTRITNRAQPGFLIIDTVSPESAGLRVRDTEMDVVIPQLASI